MYVQTRVYNFVFNFVYTYLLFFVFVELCVARMQTQKFCQYFPHHIKFCDPGSSVGIATGYGLDGLGIESRWDRDYPHLSRPALGPTQPPVQWVLGLSRGKERQGRDADPSPTF
jgi:hypothetical protein